MSRGREYTISQLKRKKAKAAKHLKEGEMHISPHSIGMRANTPTMCSCHMCGNPRKYNGNGKHGQTLDEQKPSLQEHVSEGQVMSELELMD